MKHNFHLFLGAFCILYTVTGCCFYNSFMDDEEIEVDVRKPQKKKITIIYQSEEPKK